MPVAALVLVLASTPAHSQQIAADRPGIGVDPEVVPQFTLQPEIGSDGQELRLGILKGFELDYQRGAGDSAEGVKLALADGPVFKASLRLAYDRQWHATLEVPANVALTRWFNLGLDAQWSQGAHTYAAEFNFQPTGRLTITPTAYYDTRARAAIFAAWIPRGLDAVQFDIGYNQDKLSVGISAALDFARLLHRR